MRISGYLAHIVYDIKTSAFVNMIVNENWRERAKYRESERERGLSHTQKDLLYRTKERERENEHASTRKRFN